MGENSTQSTNAPLRILCFGDSLTEGYSFYGSIFTPYSMTMKTELEVKFWAGNAKRKVEVVTDGQSGDAVIPGGFTRRMDKRYSVDTTLYPLYDWVIFLGGTNDLGWGKPPSEIWTAIKAVTAIPLSHGAKVLLMTIPECEYKSAALDAKRDAVNKSIKEDSREGVYVFDLHAAIPFHAMPELERDEIWDDGLHFREEGYERMGQLVAARLVEILEAEKTDEGDA